MLVSINVTRCEIKLEVGAINSLTLVLKSFNSIEILLEVLLFNTDNIS